MGSAGHLRRPGDGEALWDEEAWQSPRWMSFAADTEPQSVGEGQMDTLEDLQRRGIRFLTRSTWLLLAIFSLMAIFASAKVWWVVAALFVCAAAQTYAWLREGPLFTACAIVAAGAAPIPTCIIFAFRLAGLNPDLLVPFLVAPIIIIGLCDRRLIGFATAAFMAQYLGLRLFEKISIGFRPENIWGICVESLGILLVAFIATTIAGSITRLVQSASDARRENAQSAELLNERSEELNNALHRVEIERQDRERFEIEQTAARKQEIRRIANDFEASISVVTTSISKTAMTLERTTKALNEIAHDTGQRAADVSDTAQSASNAARTVAQGVAELSSAIANIAANVSQQNDLTTRAANRSISGGEAVGTLTNHSDTIGEATRAIVRIAERTNLLSLNAAIEAASAGPAGRGFTIVAQEVKALAAQASEAATEIDDFLKGVRSGTQEAERSFAAIDSAITELAQAATAIRWDVESQRKSADTIEDYARGAAEDVGAMAQRSLTLSGTASEAEKLSTQLDEATSAVLRDVRDLEQSTAQFVANLKAG